MSEVYSVRKAAHIERRLRLLLLANLCISGAVLVGWRHVAGYLSDPIRWATWVAPGPNPGLFDYPFAMLWALPLVAFAVAWTLRLGGSRRTAMWIALFPPLYLATLIACFHLLPQIMQ